MQGNALDEISAGFTNILFSVFNKYLEQNILACYKILGTVYRKSLTANKCVIF